MTRAQFDTLAAVFWKTATAAQLQRTYVAYHEATADVPPHLLDQAISEALRTSERIPFPSWLRTSALNRLAYTTTRPVKSTEGCPACGGMPFQSVKDDGMLHRFYLRHAPGCRLESVIEKPEAHHWRDHWEQAGKAVYAKHDPAGGHAGNVAAVLDRVVASVAVPAHE